MIRSRRVFALLLAACAAAPASASDPALAWLQGCRAAEGGEHGSGEHWTTPAGGSMLGMSRTVRTGRTAGYAFLRIAQATDGRLALHALPSGQPQAVFPLPRQDEDTVVFQNPAHDFPRRVIYRRIGRNGLHARIEGKGIDFPMSRSACL